MLAAGIAGSALAVGSIHTVTLWAVTAVLGVAAALEWWPAEPIRMRPSATMLIVTGIALTVFTFLQCTPLPASLVAAVAPYNADVWARSLSPLRESGPAWVTLSLDPVATRVEVVKGVAYLLAFVAALKIGRNKDGVWFLSATIVVTGVVLAIAALLHPAFGAHKLFGVYQPGPGISERHIAPLMNPNNLAGYLNVAFCLALALTFAPEPRVPRPIVAATALLLGATQIWVASRGGVVAMVLGALIVLAIARSRRSKQTGSTGALSIAAGVVAAVGAALIVLGGSDDASKELLVADTSKLKMFGRMMRMLPSVPFVGCGRGAFESAFPAFRNDPGHRTYTHPENVVAEWVLEWGILVGVAGLASIVWALRPSAVVARSTTASGAWAALLALTVQNIAELGTEIPGLMLAAVVCAAIVVAGAPGRAQHWGVERWSLAPRRVAAASGFSTALAVALGASAIGRGLHDDQHALERAALGPPVPSVDIHALARDAMLRHPAEPYLPFAVAVRAARAADDNPIPWIGATLDRAAIYGPAHLILARVLVPRSPSQARLEYRVAAQQTPEILPLVIHEALNLVGSFDDAMELVPQGPTAPGLLEGLAAGLLERLPATSVRLDAALAGMAPDNPGYAERAAKAELDDLADHEGAPWCDGPQRVACVRDALRKATRAEQLSPGTCASYELRAQALLAAVDPATALAELERASEVVTDRIVCLQHLVLMAEDLGDVSRVNEGLDRLINAGCSDDAECARNLAWVAWREESRGNAGKALVLYKRASERVPDNEVFLQEVARLASEMGLHVESAQDYERLARKHPENGRWKQAAIRERDAAVRGAIRL